MVSYWLDIFFGDKHHDSLDHFRQHQEKTCKEASSIHKEVFITFPFHCVQLLIIADLLSPTNGFIHLQVSRQRHQSQNWKRAAKGQKRRYHFPLFCCYSSFFHLAPLSCSAAHLWWHGPSQGILSTGISPSYSIVLWMFSLSLILHTVPY